MARRNGRRLASGHHRQQYRQEKQQSAAGGNRGSPGKPRPASWRNYGQEQAVRGRHDPPQQQQHGQPRLDRRERRSSLTSPPPPPPPPRPLPEMRRSLPPGLRLGCHGRAPSSNKKSSSHRSSTPELESDNVIPANVPRPLPSGVSHRGDGKVRGREYYATQPRTRSNPPSSTRPYPQSCRAMSAGVEDGSRSGGSGLGDETASQYSLEEEELEIFERSCSSLSASLRRSLTPPQLMTIGSHPEGRMQEERVPKSEEQRDNR